MITGYNGTDTVVVIPSKINGITVETIGHTAFRYSSVTSVTIPDSVTFISDSAFAYCSSLTNISIPNSVTAIGSFAFEGCTKLESITLPSSLLTISEFLFYDCSQLTTIHIPDSVSSIRQYAFYNCGKLETIRIPVSVTSIGSYAFDDCPSSMTVTYSGSKKQWDAITKGSYNGVLENNLICAKLEADIAELDDPEEKAMFMEELGVAESGLHKLIKASYTLLGLISFLTAGSDECRAWTIKKGTKAPQAAGKIHTDFERGFIRAEVIAFDDMKACGTMAAAKAKGLVRSEGKEYVMKDGDIVNFLFNV